MSATSFLIFAKKASMPSPPACFMTRALPWRGQVPEKCAYPKVAGKTLAISTRAARGRNVAHVLLLGAAGEPPPLGAGKRSTKQRTTLRKGVSNLGFGRKSAPSGWRNKADIARPPCLPENRDPLKSIRVQCLLFNTCMVTISSNTIKIACPYLVCLICQAYEI